MKHCIQGRIARRLKLSLAMTLMCRAAGGQIASAQAPAVIEGLKTPPAQLGMPSAGKAASGLDALAPLPSSAIVDPEVKQAQCCGSLVTSLGSGGGGCSSCGGSGCCVPGREPCSWCNYDTCCGRMLGAFYDCVCCPDPCYEPKWVGEANAAFFQDGARPVTQTRIRYDGSFNINYPDTAEYYWARAPRGPKNPEPRIDINSLRFYQEIAAKGFSFFVEIPYLEIDPIVNTGKSGFGDINLGTKSLLLDCELMQMTFQFRTFIPSASPTNGLGTGHTSLEPALLTTFKLAPLTYLQTELAEWIPLGGDTNGAGAIIHYHLSLNHACWRPSPSVGLIGTLEFNGYTFQDGTFINANGVQVNANGNSYLQAGPGIRFELCNKIDLGVGSGFGLSNHGPAEEYRVDFRVRF